MKDDTEKVNHPSHYNQGKIEVIDAIEDWDLNFCEGNVINLLMTSYSRHEVCYESRRSN